MDTTEINYRPYTHPTFDPGEQVFHVYRGEKQIGAIASADFGTTWRASRLFQGQAVGERSRCTMNEAKAFVERV